MGADVGPALHEVHLWRARKSVLSGSGYEDGERATVGASRKGRIWSHRRDRVDQLVEWCKKIGAKLLDSDIDPDEVLKGTLEAQTVVTRPAKMPISIDWPEVVYTDSEAHWSILIGEQEYYLSELSIEMISSSFDGPLRFSIAAETDRTELELELFEKKTEFPDYRFVVRDDRSAQVRRRGHIENAAEFFYGDPPVIWFADGSALEGNQYVELKIFHPPYDAAKINPWNWTGVDIRKEL